MASGVSPKKVKKVVTGRAVRPSRGLSDAVFKRIAKSEGCRRISKDAVQAGRAVLRSFLKRILRALHAQTLVGTKPKKTFTSYSILLAAKQAGFNVVA